MSGFKRITLELTALEENKTHVTEVREWLENGEMRKETLTDEILPYPKQQLHHHVHTSNNSGIYVDKENGRQEKVLSLKGDYSIDFSNLFIDI